MLIRAMAEALHWPRLQRRDASCHLALDNARAVFPSSAIYCDSLYEAATGADALALVTEWNEFKFLNLERVRNAMRHPVIFDGRNLWEPERMRRLGFEYHSVGRKPVLPA